MQATRGISGEGRRSPAGARRQVGRRPDEFEALVPAWWLRVKPVISALSAAGLLALLLVGL
jgi:hypothetical protein